MKKKAVNLKLLVAALKKENFRLQKQIADSEAKNISAVNKARLENPLQGMSVKRLRNLIAKLEESKDAEPDA